MKVREIMTKELVVVTTQMNAKEALELLFKKHISGLPVIEEQGKLVGMFTEKSILKTILPSYLDKVGKFIYDENPKAIRKKISELEKIMVSQIMRKDIVTVDEDVSLCEAARVMLTQKVRRIPVLDKDKKLVGIVAREDIVRAFTKDIGI